MTLKQSHWRPTSYQIRRTMEPIGKAKLVPETGSIYIYKKNINASEILLEHTFQLTLLKTDYEANKLLNYEKKF